MLKKQYMTYLLFSGVLLLLSGCQSSKTIYYWDGYQENLYNYNQPDKSSYSEKIVALEKSIEKAKSANKPIPPGLHAHLGLLYTTQGNNNKAIEQFELEKTLFPESKNFIEFVERKYQGR